MTRVRVHVITPGSCSTPTIPGSPPSDAVVLFDGTSLAAWRTENGAPPKWKIQDGSLEVVADGQASAIFGQSPPLVNASRPPGEWQSYDIVYTGPRFKDGKVAVPGYVTVFHNGVITQYHTQILGATKHRVLPTLIVHGPNDPIKLQDHGNPVRFRNIWIRPLGSDNPS